MSTRTVLRAFALAFALLLIGALWRISQAQTAPELPRAVPSTGMPAITGVVRSVAAGADVQAAINAAQPGDVLEFPCAGQTYSGNFTLPDKGASIGWVIFRPACHASLPPVGTRITPAIAAALKLPTFVAPNAAPVFTTAPGAHHYRWIGLEVTVGYAGGTNTLFALGSDVQRTVAEIPHDLVLDRLYLHGTPTTNLRRCIALNSASTAIVDSWCADAHENGSDSQAIMGWTGPGPYLIRNNHLEAASEVILFGGGDPLIPGLVPSDISVLHNHITRPVAWKDVWAVKNLFELKNAARVLVDGNVMENNWADAQDGAGVVLKSTNQDGSCTWCGTVDVTVRRNILRNTGGAFNLAAHPDPNPVVPLARVAITDNLITAVNVGAFRGVGTLFMVQEDIADLSIARNTAVTEGIVGTLTFLPFGTPPTRRFRFTDNLTAAATNYGILGGNTGPGTVALSAYAPDGVVTGNLFAGMNELGLASYEAGYPPGNRFLAQTADVGFRDVAAGDFTRAVRDSIGVDLAQLAATTAGVVEGSGPTPVPAPLPTITLTQLRAAITALDKVVSPAGRESKATKAALVPVDVYLHALLGATP